MTSSHFIIIIENGLAAQLVSIESLKIFHIANTTAFLFNSDAYIASENCVERKWDIFRLSITFYIYFPYNYYGKEVIPMNGKNFSASLAKSRQFGNDKSLRNLVNELSGLDIAERENRLRTLLTEIYDELLNDY